MYRLSWCVTLVTGTYCMLHCIYCCYLIQYKETPVHAAVFNGHVEALNVLIRAKADVNTVNVVSLIFICILHEIIFMVQIINLSGQKANKRGSICYMYMYVCISVHTIIILCTYAHQGYAFGHIGKQKTGCLVPYCSKISCEVLSL